MIEVFEGNTANEVWLKAVARILDEQHARPQIGRGGITQELLHVAFTIQDPRQRWVLARQPGINPAFAIAEVFWILGGRRDSAFLNYWNSQLPKYAGSGSEYHGAYGFRLRQHFGFDQLKRAYLAFQHNPEGRQIVLQIWDPVIDFPNETGQPVNADIPCNICSLLKVRGGRLEWTQIMRSNDIFRGVPYNFIQFTSMQEVLAGWLGIEPGSYTHVSDSLHLYHADAQHLEIDPPALLGHNTDSLSLPKVESDMILAKVCQFIDSMRTYSFSQKDLSACLGDLKTPFAFKNLLCIVAAEAARKRGWIALAEALVSDCSNSMLTQAWERWFTRFR